MKSLASQVHDKLKEKSDLAESRLSVARVRYKYFLSQRKPTSGLWLGSVDDLSPIQAYNDELAVNVVYCYNLQLVLVESGAWDSTFLGYYVRHNFSKIVDRFIFKV